MALDPAVDEELSRMLDEWMDRQLNETLAANADSLESIYGLTSPSLPCAESSRT